MESALVNPGDPLSEREVRGIERHIGRIVGTRSLGMSELEDLLAGHLLIDVRPVSVLTLSELTGYSRRSIKDALHDLKCMGMAERTPIGWVLTPEGSSILIQIARETNLIARGELRGYSGGLLERLGFLPTNGVKRPFKVDGL